MDSELKWKMDIEKRLWALEHPDKDTQNSLEIPIAGYRRLDSLSCGIVIGAYDLIYSLISDDDRAVIESPDFTDFHKKDIRERILWSLECCKNYLSYALSPSSTRYYNKHQDGISHFLSEREYLRHKIKELLQILHYDDIAEMTTRDICCHDIFIVVGILRKVVEDTLTRMKCDPALKNLVIRDPEKNSINCTLGHKDFLNIKGEVYQVHEGSKSENLCRSCVFTYEVCSCECRHRRFGGKPVYFTRVSENRG